MNKEFEHSHYGEESYLTSENVIKLTGVSRRMLSTVEKKELCTPHRDSPHSGTLRWTPEQVHLVEQVDTLRKNGASFEEISKIVNDKHASIDSITAETHTELMRSSRRALKRSVLRQYHMADFRKCGIREGYYLRYIPQRYFALIPQRYESLMDAKSRMRATVALASVIDHVGWARTETLGGILGAPQPYDATCFACIELPCLPYPTPVESDDMDSGCYHDYGGICALGAEDACSHCARFGNVADPSEKLMLSQIAPSVPAEPFNVMASKLERPYFCGPWSSFTARFLQTNGGAAQQGDGDFMVGHPQNAPELSPAARPQLMPQLVELPLGITACVLPAGYYLCRQCQDGKQLQFLSEMIGTVRVIPQRERTLDIERKISGQLASTIGATRGSGPDGFRNENPDMYAKIHPIGDPVQRGQWREIDYSKLVELTIPSAMGLTPESDFPIIWTTLPSPDADAKPLYELQVPLSTDDFEIGENSAKKSPESLGIVADVPRINKSEELNSLRCRLCGSRLHPSKDASVLACDNCGNAQPQMRLTNDRRMLLLQKAEEERALGNFDGAQIDCALACKLDHDDPDAHWLLMLCRYGITYRKDPASGRYMPYMARPTETPLELDEDCIAALALSDDAQWIIYKRQLTLLETARTRALAER